MSNVSANIEVYRRMVLLQKAIKTWYEEHAERFDPKAKGILQKLDTLRGDFRDEMTLFIQSLTTKTDESKRLVSEMQEMIDKNKKMVDQFLTYMVGSAHTSDSQSPC